MAHGGSAALGPARRDALALGAIVLIAIALLLPRLDDRALWEDEAETALLARNVLAFGVPLGWDGRALVSQECGADLDARGLWRQSPWLPIYTVAAAFRLLGIDTWTARLPFVLLAVVTLPSLWLAARRIFEDRSVALLAPLVLALSVPYLLYARQGRYYSLVAFAMVWILAFVVPVLRGSRAAVIGLTLALTVLFHANYLIFAASIVALAGTLALLRPDRGALRRLAVTGLLVAGLNLPWLGVFDAAGQTSTTWQLASRGAFLVRLGSYLRAIELYLCPTLLLAAVVLFVWIVRRRGTSVPGLAAAGALAVGSVLYVVTLSVAPLLFFRYLVGLLPVLALLTAWTVVTVARRHRVLALALLVVMIAVDRADLVHGRLGVPLAKYVDEITHDFDGPIEAVARFLAAEARTDDRVYVTYGALSLRFHTMVERPTVGEVRGGTGCQSLEGWSPPEWLVVRSVFRLNPIAPAGREDAERVRQWLNALIVSGRYQRIELPAIDIAHDALPEPDLHLYRTPREGPRVAIWKRRE